MQISGTHNKKALGFPRAPRAAGSFTSYRGIVWRLLPSPSPTPSFHGCPSLLTSSSLPQHNTYIHLPPTAPAIYLSLCLFSFATSIVSISAEVLWAAFCCFSKPFRRGGYFVSGIDGRCKNWVFRSLSLCWLHSLQLQAIVFLAMASGAADPEQPRLSFFDRNRGKDVRSLALLLWLLSILVSFLVICLVSVVDFGCPHFPSDVEIWLMFLNGCLSWCFDGCRCCLFPIRVRKRRRRLTVLLSLFSMAAVLLRSTLFQLLFSR